MFKKLYAAVISSATILNLANFAIVSSALMYFDLQVLLHLYWAYTATIWICYVMVPHIGKVNLIHYTEVPSYLNIKEDGFHRGKFEQYYGDEYSCILGQKGQDLVSACFIKTSPYKEMRKSLGGHVIPTYFQSSVSRVSMTKAIKTELVFHKDYGWSFEALCDRQQVNVDIMLNGISSERPAKFYQWKHVVLVLSALCNTVSLKDVTVLRRFMSTSY